MNKEFFGVFGDRGTFRRYRSETEFDRVVEGSTATVGIRDVGLGIPGRSMVFEGEAGVCVLWGEVYPPDGPSRNAARWLLNRYAAVGRDALAELNGSYLAFVDDGETAFVATDPLRSWECYYADTDGVRLFGTAPKSVAAHLDAAEPATEALREFLQLGVVLGDRTTLSGLSRTPFDGLLFADGTEELRRFVYDPTEFDYAGELATRLERAFARRSQLPGRKGLLLSGGYDSRTLLAGLPDIDECYTIGTADSRETEVARKVAGQYGVPHRLLTADERYLRPDPEAIDYGHGIRESLHIHHAAYDPEIEADTMFHGLLWDTLFRGHFLPEAHAEALGYEFPLNRLHPDPNLAETLVDRKFGFFPAGGTLIDADATAASSRAAALEAVEGQLEGMGDRYDSIYNAIDLVGIRNQPTMSFRTHLADHYLESFVVADRELIDWHLRTPPEHRNSKTLLRAIRQLDGDILKHRPPDRPFDSRQLNSVHNFLRKKCPVLTDLDGPWPNRSQHYDRNRFDQRLFPDCPSVHCLPPRLKLRINDINTWLDETSDDGEASPAGTLRLPV